MVTTITPTSNTNQDRNSKCWCLPIKTATAIVAVIEFIGVLIALVVFCHFYRLGGYGIAAASNFKEVPVNLSNGDSEKALSGSAADKNVRVGDQTIGLIFMIAGFISTIVFIIILIIGVFKNRPKFILAHLIFQGLGVLALLIGMIIYALDASGAISISDRETSPHHISVQNKGVEYRGLDVTLDPNTENQFKMAVYKIRCDTAVAYAVILALAAALVIGMMFVVYKCYKFVASWSAGR